MSVKPSFVGMFVVVLGKESWRSFQIARTRVSKKTFMSLFHF